MFDFLSREVSMSRLLKSTALVAALSVLPAVTHAAIITVDPDNFQRVSNTGVPTSDFQNISLATPGVRLSAYGMIDGNRLISSNVYAVLTANTNPAYSDTPGYFASTGIYSFGANVNFNGDTAHITPAWTAGTGSTPDRNLRIDFDTPVAYFALDVIADRLDDRSIVEVFNTQDQLLGSLIVPAEGGLTLLKRVFTAEFSRDSSDISYALAHSPTGVVGKTVGFDNLRFSVASLNSNSAIPEPTTISGLALAALPLLRRRPRRRN
jgi:hypothetical protein